MKRHVATALSVSLLCMFLVSLVALAGCTPPPDQSTTSITQPSGPAGPGAGLTNTVPITAPGGSGPSTAIVTMTTPSPAQNGSPSADEKTVTSLRGYVGDRQGRPIQGIVVVAYTFDQELQDWLNVDRADSDDNGRFAFSHATSGRYKLGYFDPANRYRTEYYTNRRDLDGARTILVTSNITNTNLEDAAFDSEQENDRIDATLDEVAPPVAQMTFAQTVTVAAAPGGSGSLAFWQPPSVMAAPPLKTEVVITSTDLTVRADQYTGLLSVCRSRQGLSGTVIVTFTQSASCDPAGYYLESGATHFCDSGDASCVRTETKDSPITTFTLTFAFPVDALEEGTLRLHYRCGIKSVYLDLAEISVCDPRGRVTNGVGNPVPGARVYHRSEPGVAGPVGTAGVDCIHSNAKGTIAAVDNGWHPDWSGYPTGTLASSTVNTGFTDNGGNFEFDDNPGTCGSIEVRIGFSGGGTTCPLTADSPIIGIETANPMSITDLDYQCPTPTPEP